MNTDYVPFYVFDLFALFRLMQHMLVISELCVSMQLFFLMWYHLDYLFNILLNNFPLQYSQFLSLITLD